MSKHGLKINNYEAASLYEYEHGLRSRPDTTKAMLVNSLFLDYLMDNGLIQISKNDFTRDIICLQFTYGTKDYETTMSKLSGMDNVTELKQNIEANKEYCVKMSRDELREKVYTEGISITYKTYNKQHAEIKDLETTIRYKMLYRTPGKAKKGTCMFVNERIYDQVHNFLYMGIELPKEHAPIVEMGAYSSLITSSVVDRIKILPEQILILKDVDSFFKTKVLSVETDEKKHCQIVEKENYEVVNTLFDGQALIDSSIFPEWADGYILLRHHMTKVAAFHTDIELFMREHYGDQYDSAYITDMFGRSIKVSEIKLITTDNAIKWKKFGVTFDYWASWVRKNGCMFGIVKTSHESKLGNVQRMSYQMMNSLDIDSMESVCQKSVEYVNALKNDNEEFLKYLEKNQTFSNDFEVLLALIKHNKNFVNSEYFRERKQNIINAYILNLKNGHSIQDADNLTIVGSPYAMLLYSVGEDPFSDPTLRPEERTIQCYSERFDDGEYMAAFRSPHNARNNIVYLHNCRYELMKKFFHLGNYCIAINMIQTDFQCRANGADMDSDSVYTTNQKDIVEHARYCYEHYPTIVNNIPKDSNVYNYDMKDFAKVDNGLAASQLAIGESSNLAQICLTYTYNFPDKKYQDYVCILSVLAQVAVDSAKRAFDINLTDEIRRIKKDMDVEENGLPDFWLLTKRDKRKVRNEKERRERDLKNKKRIRKNVNSTLLCPMNYLYNLEFERVKYDTEALPMEEFWIDHKHNVDRRKSKEIENLIEKYSLDLYNYNVSHGKEPNDYLLLIDQFDELIADIRKVYISKNYLGMMSWLINRAFEIGAGVRRNKKGMNSSLSKNRALLLKVLYVVSPEIFLQCFVQLI
jgi:hypothetical protein